MSPPRKDPIPNQDKKNLGLKKDQCLTSDVPPFIPGKKSPINKENNDNHETTDTSHIEKYYTSHTNRDDYIEKFKDIKIPMTMTNTERVLRNIKMVMKVLIILKLQILHVMKVLSTQTNRK